MNYQVLSRRYRPKHFKDVIGQQSVIKVLTNSIAANKIPHAFLFTGIRGTGKTTTARIFARAINCKEGIKIEPCDICESCKEILDGKSIDVMEIDGASNTSVNDVRILRENTRFLPAHLRYKVYIIDEVHMLSNEAFNALLKTLEEPPEYVIFILATTEPHKIPETVLSRCIRLNFKRVEPGEIVKYLSYVLDQEKVEYEESALYLVARQSEGSVRDSLSFLELVLAYGDGRVTEKDVVRVLGLLSKETIYEMIELLAEKNTGGIIDLINRIDKEGGDIFNFLERVIFYIRHLVMYLLNVPIEKSEFSQAEINYLMELSKKFVKEELIIYYQALRQILEQMRFSPYPRYDFEVGLLKVVYLKEFLEDANVFYNTEKGDGKKETKQVDKIEDEKISTADEKQDVIENLIKILKSSSKLEAYLKNANIFLDGKILKIVFPATKKIFYDYFIDNESGRKQVEKTVKTSLGKDFTISFLVEEVTESEKNGLNSKEDIYERDSIKKILKSFKGAKILGVREVEELKIQEDSVDQNIEIEEREVVDE
ncbi:MAG: DNA polymerase III subunit gamma/tau [Proteobacteria bacterium]|nr:DNA polymerase III subunit gamma/tau [Pseudomonadota bacterium]